MNSEANGQENYQLDMTPETQSWTDSALIAGRGYTDANAGVTITPLSVGDGGASVNVSFGNVPNPCIQANPSISISPSETRWIGAGSSAAYTVTVTNNNSANCSNNDFNLQTNVPDEWNGVFSSPNLNISPGTSASTTFQLNSPSSAADGFYTVGINAVNNLSPSYLASVSATIAISSNLGVAAATDRPSYNLNQSVTVTALVRANGSAVSGANVTFNITKPNGGKIIGSAITAANGSASYVYKFKRNNDPLGTYLVNVGANFNGISGSGSTSFTVR
jgi:hypothetical protein